MTERESAILKALNAKSKTTAELRVELGYPVNQAEISALRSLELIEPNGKDTGSTIWQITSKGRRLI